MNAFVNYMIEANMGICFFLLVYKIFLNHETDYRFNRIYLLAAIILSIALPFIHFTIQSVPFLDNTLQSYWLPEIQVTEMETVSRLTTDSLSLMVYIVYSLGAAISLILLTVRLSKIMKLIQQSAKISHDRICVVEAENSHEVFSFFKYIFIGRSITLTKNERDQIIRHESVHALHYHSLDILLINLVGIVFWFNPLLKIYRKLFIQLHEFEADARSVKSDEVNEYCSLLAKAALNSSGYQLANHFTNSLTIKRIEMMKTLKTKIGRWKVISIAGTALAFCLVMGCANTKSLNSSSSDKVYDMVDEIPTFGQGNDLWNYIAKHLQYPEDAVKKRVEGKVFTKFIVEKDGTITHVSVTKGIGSGCDEAASEVIKSLPPWNPGTIKGKAVRTSFVIPISFQLDEPKKGD